MEINARFIHRCFKFHIYKSKTTAENFISMLLMIEDLYWPSYCFNILGTLMSDVYNVQNFLLCDWINTLC
jgi:hypothetical protein